MSMKHIISLCNLPNKKKTTIRNSMHILSFSPIFPHFSGMIISPCLFKQTLCGFQYRLIKTSGPVVSQNKLYLSISIHKKSKKYLVLTFHPRFSYASLSSSQKTAASTAAANRFFLLTNAPASDAHKVLQSWPGHLP